MSSSPSKESPVKGGKAWSEAEKYQFLLKCIAQIGGGATPKFDKVDLPGRTPKAMSLMWSKIKNEMTGGAEGTKPVITTPRKPVATTPRKRKANGEASGTPASKKKTPAKNKKGKKFVANDSDDEEPEPDLGETEEEDDLAPPKPEEDDEDDFVIPNNELSYEA